MWERVSSAPFCSAVLKPPLCVDTHEVWGWRVRREDGSDVDTGRGRLTDAGEQIRESSFCQTEGVPLWTDPPSLKRKKLRTEEIKHLTQSGQGQASTGCSSSNPQSSPLLQISCSPSTRPRPSSLASPESFLRLYIPEP